MCEGREGQSGWGVRGLRATKEGARGPPAGLSTEGPRVATASPGCPQARTPGSPPCPGVCAVGPTRRPWEARRAVSTKAYSRDPLSVVAADLGQGVCT